MFHIVGFWARVRGWRQSRWHSWQSIIRIVPQAGQAVTVAAVLNLVIGLLPLGFVVATSVAIDRVPALGHSTRGAWGPVLAAMALAIVVLLLQSALSPFQAAFTELVRRHLNLVYSVALRRLGGDAHRAADVVQSVFVDLARKAENVSAHPVITGWLYTSTRHAADQVQRTERRRAAREESFMRQATNETAATDAAWGRLRVVLDDAMGDLNETERTAVLLRFFEDLSSAEIARRSGIPEGTVRRRLKVALDELRDRLHAEERKTGQAVIAALTPFAVKQAAASAGRAAPNGRTSATATATSGCGGRGPNRRCLGRVSTRSATSSGTPSSCRRRVARVVPCCRLASSTASMNMAEMRS